MRKLAIFASLMIATAAHATDMSPLPKSQTCDAVEALEADYPDSKFTRLSDEQFARVNPPAGAATAYSVAYPHDPHLIVIHMYDHRGCWMAAAQVSADRFYALIEGGSI